MKTFGTMIIAAVAVCISVIPASGQVRVTGDDLTGGRKLEMSVPLPPSRFSGAVEAGGRLFFGEKAGEVVSADAVIGVKQYDHLFFGIGLGYDRYFIVNSQYTPMEPPAGEIFWFGRPRILKGDEFSLFLDFKDYWGEGRFKPTIEGRAALSFANPGLGGKILSFGAGCRYDLTRKTGVALRAFYEFKSSFHGDDFYDSEQGIFHSAGLHLSYEF
jgi:hypothetical protein